MFKTLTLLARRPDLTREGFVHRYETGHAKLGERLLRGAATRYVRRYLNAVDGRAGIADLPDAFRGRAGSQPVRQNGIIALAERGQEMLVSDWHALSLHRLAPRTPELQQSADRAHRWDDRLRDEFESRRLEDDAIDLLLRAEKDRPAIGQSCAQRFRDGDPGIQMPAGSATCQENGQRLRQVKLQRSS